MPDKKPTDTSDWAIDEVDWDEWTTTMKVPIYTGFNDENAPSERDISMFLLKKR